MTFKYYEGLGLEDMVLRFRKDYLTKTGWLASAETKEAVDNDGPIPWYTYPALEILRKITRADMSVFEYGGGGSTVWWSRRTARIVAVDHDPEWVNHTREALREGDVFETVPMNAPCDQKHVTEMAPYFELDLPKRITGDKDKNLRRGLLDKEFSAYAAFLMHYPPQMFDIVCVDGMARNLTAWIAAQYVKPDGFIVFDNADRDDYAAGYEVLRGAGFVRIDFTGPGPINPYAWTTSIWTKTLDIFRY